MTEKKSVLDVTKGTGLLTYLEKGEWSTASGRRAAATKDVHSLRVENGALVVPPELEKKLGLEPGARLEIVFNGARAEVLPNIHSLNRLYIEPAL